jgi:hypothetical protein
MSTSKLDACLLQECLTTSILMVTSEPFDVDETTSFLTRQILDSPGVTAPSKDQADLDLKGLDALPLTVAIKEHLEQLFGPKDAECLEVVQDVIDLYVSGLEQKERDEKGEDAEAEGSGKTASSRPTWGTCEVTFPALLNLRLPTPNLQIDVFAIDESNIPPSAPSFRTYPPSI